MAPYPKVFCPASSNACMDELEQDNRTYIKKKNRMDFFILQVVTNYIWCKVTYFPMKCKRKPMDKTKEPNGFKPLGTNTLLFLSDGHFNLPYFITRYKYLQPAYPLPKRHGYSSCHQESSSQHPCHVAKNPCDRKHS